VRGRRHAREGELGQAGALRKHEDRGGLARGERILAVARDLNAKAQRRKGAKKREELPSPRAERAWAEGEESDEGQLSSFFCAFASLRLCVKNSALPSVPGVDGSRTRLVQRRASRLEVVR